MISSYVGENAEFERQFLSGELEVIYSQAKINTLQLKYTVNSNQISLG